MRNLKNDARKGFPRAPILGVQKGPLAKPVWRENDLKKREREGISLAMSREESSLALSCPVCLDDPMNIVCSLRWRSFAMFYVLCRVVQ